MVTAPVSSKVPAAMTTVTATVATAMAATATAAAALAPRSVSYWRQRQRNTHCQYRNELWFYGALPFGSSSGFVSNRYFMPESLHRELVRSGTHLQAVNALGGQSIRDAERPDARHAQGPWCWVEPRPTYLLEAGRKQDRARRSPVWSAARAVPRRVSTTHPRSRRQTSRGMKRRSISSYRTRYRRRSRLEDVPHRS